MSCRIVRPATHEKAQVAPWATARSQSAKGEAGIPGRAPAPNRSEADLLKPLHARIVELEAALEVDVKAAREAAYEEGVQAGREQAVREVEQTVERMGKVLSELAGMRMRLRREAEADLVQLSLSIARRILRRELSVDPEAIGALVKSALEKIQSRELTRVRIHPEQATALRQCMAKLHAGTVEIQADAALRPGDLIFETRRGDLDASVETQLAEIERGFADRIGR